MKHICFVVSAMTSGGAERVVSILSNYFVGTNKVTIIMVSEINVNSFYELDKRINLIALCSNYKNKTKPFKRVKLLKKMISTLNPDVVIAFLPHICIYAWLAMRKLKIPLVVSERNDPNQYSFFYKIMLKHVFNNASKCVFQTNDAMNWYKKSCSKSKATVIFNPISIDENIKRPTLREKTVLFVGSNDSRKNIPMMLKAFELFHQKQPNYVLKIYGNGFTGDYVKQFVSKTTNESILLMGNDNNWQIHEYNASIYLSSSNYEGMSNSLAESAALGIVCVATNCPIGGSKELSNYFNNIVLVNCNDYKMMAEKMLEHIDEKDNYCPYIPTEFRVEEISKKWLDFIFDNE